MIPLNDDMSSYTSDYYNHMVIIRIKVKHGEMYQFNLTNQPNTKTENIPVLKRRKIGGKMKKK